MIPIYRDGKAVGATSGDDFSCTLNHPRFLEWLATQRKTLEQWLAANPAPAAPPARKARPVATLITELQALTAAEKTKLNLAIQAAFLQEHPQFAKTLGLNIVGDEDA